ncbi:hypothetical protein [Arthrobacter bambusae]|uniref:Uncharacterized protein n=1 Tax=Arthrobacter bambusae TaxID=1338426 RepID=A0AAW8DCW8_9MICC|nr:hypothetical protein [Arthrobacter bambusae]MDP9903271.1 hypothetical protein [Arthrobacter bambusae]MDQ0128735.1 hypothetical protein [Arthrobacter bambusae]MDQ0180076.1 hypothetical protein [Arthrobacter bambusae]
MGQHSTSQSNLDNQKKSAEFFLSIYPGVKVERIRFTQDGNFPGLGAPWSANAIVTVDGKEYREILGFEYGAIGGDSLPGAASGRTPSPGMKQPPVDVVFSDGSTEVLGDR